MLLGGRVRCFSLRGGCGGVWIVGVVCGGGVMLYLCLVISYEYSTITLSCLQY